LRKKYSTIFILSGINIVFFPVRTSVMAEIHLIRDQCIKIVRLEAGLVVIWNCRIKHIFWTFNQQDLKTVSNK